MNRGALLAAVALVVAPLAAPMVAPTIAPLATLLGVAPAAAAVPAFSDSLLADAPDFAALRGDLLPLTAAEVAEIAWTLVPALVVQERPDLLAGFLQFWEDRCGASEPVTRTRLLAAIWDGAFDESLYDESLGADVRAWQTRDPEQMSSGRREFDAFTADFADQLLPHQAEGSLPEYFCLLYSDRSELAAAALADDRLADTWARWYVEHPDDADSGGEVIPGDEATAGDGDAGTAHPTAGPASLLLTVGGWWPTAAGTVAGSHVLVGGLLEQRLGPWFVRLPVEVRLGRADRPYRVDRDAVDGWSDRFDAVYFGGECGRRVLAAAGLDLEAFAGLGFDGVRPFAGQDLVLATVNASLGLGLRWQVPGTPLRLGADVRREWLGPREAGGEGLGGGAWSLRAGLGPRFGPGAGSR